MDVAGVFALKGIFISIKSPSLSDSRLVPVTDACTIDADLRWKEALVASERLGESVVPKCVTGSHPSRVVD